MMVGMEYHSMEQDVEQKFSVGMIQQAGNIKLQSVMQKNNASQMKEVTNYCQCCHFGLARIKSAYILSVNLSFNGSRSYLMILCRKLSRMHE